MHCPMLLLHDRPSAVNRIIMDSTNQIRPDHRGWIQFTCNHIYFANFQGESRLAIHAQALQVYWSYRDHTSRSSCFRIQVPLMFSIQRCNAIKRTLYEIKYPRHEGVITKSRRNQSQNPAHSFSASALPQLCTRTFTPSLAYICMVASWESYSKVTRLRLLPEDCSRLRTLRRFALGGLILVKLRLVVSAVDDGAVLSGIDDVRVVMRSDVCCLMRTRTSWDAQTPLPCVLPSAEHWVDETLV
jgi:hypothetical protein